MKKFFVCALSAILLLGAGYVPVRAEKAETYEVGYAKVDINPYWHAWQSWSKDKTNIPQALRGVMPYTDFYDQYDLMPLPMAGYGNNDTRLSRPKLMDDNGSGVGAGKINVTRAKTSATATTTTTLKTDSFYSYVYANNPDYQDVHLSSNRYTKDFAAEMGVTYSDGIYGENDGDGVWATCVLVKDPQTNSFLLVISVDNIGIDETLNSYIRKSIMEKPQIKAIGLTEDRILINANHTHGSVALGTQYDSSDTATTYTLARNTFGDGLTFTEQQLHWYLNFYKNYLRNQLANAAAEAVADLEPALTMEKGSIDAGQQTGHHMNGVRHSVQTYTPTSGSKPAITYVRGSSFNNYMRSSSSYDSHTAGNGFNTSQPVSESNDSLNILQFTFKNKQPIVMVNFRAHSTANNKEAAKALHYNISADWVSPLRYEMEQAGYRFTLLYGNSGNLGTGVSSDTNSLIPYSQAYYSAADGCWILPATPYGRAIAQAALALLGDVAENNNSITDEMHSVPMGQLRLQKNSYFVKRQEFSPLSYAAALSFYNAGSPASGGRYTIKDGATVTNGGRSITLKAGEGGTFVIASKYHANSIVARYGVVNKPAIELNTIRLGDQVAFYTTPLEAADRYFTNYITKTTDILANASNQNDWWGLNEPDAWGTPFDLSLTNGSGGYITNELAYDYGKDYTGTDYMIAIGCYESQNSNANRGEGEKIVKILNGMLRNMETREAYCSHCKSKQTFKPLQQTDISGTYALSGGHYFLAGSFCSRNQLQIPAGVQVCLDLNGFDYSCENYSDVSRAFAVDGTFNVMDLSGGEKSGSIQGLGIQTDLSASQRGGTVHVSATGVLNLYSGLLTQNKRVGYGVSGGGVAHVEGVLNIYGGSIENGTAGSGGNIFAEGGTVNLLGGTVSGGKATGNGGNIYCDSESKLHITAGTVSGGRAEKGTASTMGGNIYTAGTFLMEGGLITGGYAYYGGNVQVQSKTASFTMRGGLIEKGTAGYKTDVADLCTGQSSSEGGLSTFRMEGGYIAGAAYAQGTIILAGTNGGDAPMRVVVKAPGERLFIEGSYRGNIDLVLNDANYQGLSAGAKVGNATNADLSGANIHLPDYPELELAVSGSDLVLKAPAAATVNGTQYDTVSAAVTAYNKTGGTMVLLQDGLEISGLQRDLSLDLNGFDVAAVHTGSYKLICKDTATDDYSSASRDTYGTVPAGTACQAAAGYLKVTADNEISFHRYSLAMTQVNLRPGNTGIYYTCDFRGDELVRSQVASFGVAMSLQTGMTRNDWISTVTADTENKLHVTWDGAWTDRGVTNSVLVSGILKETASLQENSYRSGLKVNGVNFLRLADGSWLFGETCSYSLRDIVEAANDTCETIPDSLVQLYKTYESLMSQWDTGRIAAAAK